MPKGLIPLFFLTPHTEVLWEMLGIIFFFFKSCCSVYKHPNKPSTLCTLKIIFLWIMWSFIITNILLPTFHNGIMELLCGTTCMNMDSVFKNVTNMITLAISLKFLKF